MMTGTARLFSAPASARYVTYNSASARGRFATSIRCKAAVIRLLIVCSGITGYSRRHPEPHWSHLRGDNLSAPIIETTGWQTD